MSRSTCSNVAHARNDIPSSSSSTTTTTPLRQPCKHHPLEQDVGTSAATTFQSSPLAPASFPPRQYYYSSSSPPLPEASVSAPAGTTHYHALQQQQQLVLKEGGVPCRIPLSGLPCEADRKRIAACLAVILASSLYNNDGHDATTSTSSTAAEEEIQNKYSTCEDEMMDGTDFIINRNSNHKQNTHRWRTTTTATPKEATIKAKIASAQQSRQQQEQHDRHHQRAVNLLYKVTVLLFLDAHHARALEPILRIRPSATTTTGFAKDTKSGGMKKELERREGAVQQQGRRKDCQRIHENNHIPQQQQQRDQHQQQQASAEMLLYNHSTNITPPKARRMKGEIEIKSDSHDEEGRVGGIGRNSASVSHQQQEESFVDFNDHSSIAAPPTSSLKIYNWPLPSERLACRDISLFGECSSSSSSSSNTTAASLSFRCSDKFPPSSVSSSSSTSSISSTTAEVSEQVGMAFPKVNSSASSMKNNNSNSNNESNNNDERHEAVLESREESFLINVPLDRSQNHGEGTKQNNIRNENEKMSLNLSSSSFSSSSSSSYDEVMHQHQGHGHGCFGMTYKDSGGEIRPDDERLSVDDSFDNVDIGHYNRIVTPRGNRSIMRQTSSIEETGEYNSCCNNNNNKTKAAPVFTSPQSPPLKDSLDYRHTSSSGVLYNTSLSTQEQQKPNHNFTSSVRERPKTTRTTAAYLTASCSSTSPTRRKKQMTPFFSSTAPAATKATSLSIYAELIQPFLSQLSHFNSGYKCISIILLHYLLKNPTGYDARIRHVLKQLAVVVLCHQKAMTNKKTPAAVAPAANPGRVNYFNMDHLETIATRQFEDMERSIACRLLSISSEMEEVERGGKENYDYCYAQSEALARGKKSESAPSTIKEDHSTLSSSMRRVVNRESVIRGIKITSAGLMAGTLFAVTGGLAAPGIAAGIAALTQATASTAAATSAGAAAATVISTLSTPAAVTTMFGLGGGGLVGYKVQRRIRGVTEFEFRRNGRQHEPCSSNGDTSDAKSKGRHRNGQQELEASSPELFTVICLSGWLTDVNDFDRPWGVRQKGSKGSASSRSDNLRHLRANNCETTSPRSMETPNRLPHRSENSRNLMTHQCETNLDSPDNSSSSTFYLSILQQFYMRYNPENVQRATSILSQWLGEEDKLWKVLEEKYGIDPLDYYYSSTRQQHCKSEIHSCWSSLNGEIHTENSSRKRDDVLMSPPPHHCVNTRNSPGKTQQHREDAQDNDIDVLDALLEELGYTVSGKQDSCPSLGNLRRRSWVESRRSGYTSHGELNITHGSSASQEQHQRHGGSSTHMSTSSSMSKSSAVKKSDSGEHIKPKKLKCWDYQSKYAGELYTVKWESDLLIELCDSVTDIAVDMVGGATAQILKQTSLHTLMSAVAWPYALVNAANMIDGTWTLSIERSDEAGVELARSLLESEAGHRPVTLMGFSMGARTIYACLKELARHQELWEMERELTQHQNELRGSGMSRETAQFATTLFPPSISSLYSREPASIVEDAVLMGCPNHLSLPSWEACRTIVAGRLISCYSKKDLVLSLMFQYKRVRGIRPRPVCGTSPVKVAGVENYDVSDLILSHSDYCNQVKKILKRIGYGQPRSGSLPHPSYDDDD